MDASRVVFAFARWVYIKFFLPDYSSCGTDHRDNALPGSRWWKKMNSNAVPVNAVWFVMFWSGILGLLGFSVAALTSLAG